MPYLAYGSSRRLKQRRPAQAQRRRAGIIEWSSMESPATEKQKPSHRLGSLNKWCPDSESNQGHGDFQSPALPTELSGQRGALNPICPVSSTKNVVFVTDCAISHHFAASLSEKVRPKRGERHGEQQRGQHVHHGKHLDPADAQPCCQQQQAADGGKVCHHRRRSEREN